MKKLQTISTIFFWALLILLSISLELKANSTNSKQCSIWPDKSLTPSIINTLSTLQFYGPQPGFHHGLDLQAPAGTAVYAPVTGAVATGYYYERVKNPYTYEISISTPDGERWEFHHLDKNSIPESIEKLADQNSVVKCGTYLGQVFNAPQLYPEILAHIHINVINSEGYYQNPLKFLPLLWDSQAPHLNGVYLIDEKNRVVADGNSQNLSRAMVKAQKSTLVVDVVDLIPPSPVGNSIYAIQIFRKIPQVDQPPVLEQLAAISFDQLPEKNNFLTGVEQIYQIEPITFLDGRQISNQIAYDQPRRFLFRFPLAESILAQGGQISLKVVVSDFAGNQNHSELDFKVARSNRTKV